MLNVHIPEGATTLLMTRLQRHISLSDILLIFQFLSDLFPVVLLLLSGPEEDNNFTEVFVNMANSSPSYPALCGPHLNNWPHRLRLSSPTLRTHLVCFYWNVQTHGKNAGRFTGRATSGEMCESVSMTTAVKAIKPGRKVRFLSIIIRISNWKFPNSR